MPHCGRRQPDRASAHAGAMMLVPLREKLHTFAQGRAQDAISLGRTPTMLNRRRFLCTAAAASAAAFTRIPHALAATYDLIVKGGRVIDPSLGIDAVRDVAIAGGRIAAVEASIAAESAPDIIDARGKLVVPGLIDIH